MIGTNRTVERTFAILRLVADSENGITLQELSDELDIAKSSAFVIVHSLLELGYLQSAEGNDKKYRLGLEAFKLGSSYINAVSLLDQCAQRLPALAERTIKTTFLAVLNECDIVYLYKYVAKNARLATCAIGSTKPVHTTALGKAILAFLPEHEQMRIISQIEFHAYTPNTIVSKEALLKELREIRRRGYSTERGEFADMTFCCGAPIFDYTGNVIAAISLADLARENENEAMIAAELMRVADEISRMMGYIAR